MIKNGNSNYILYYKNVTKSHVRFERLRVFNLIYIKQWNRNPTKPQGLKKLFLEIKKKLNLSSKDNYLMLKK